MLQSDIEKKLTMNDALFRNIHVIQQRFDILPDEKEHIGAFIEYQDIAELRAGFLYELFDTIVDWAYNDDKYHMLEEQYQSEGKSKSAAASQIMRKVKQKFRRGSDGNLLIQGQFGELLLFHFIQRFMKAAPLLRKMPITTSAEHERHGADAIHYCVDGEKNVIVLGEAKAYTSGNFASALGNAISSILSTYQRYRSELDLYVHEDFLDDEMNCVANELLTGKLKNVEVRLVAVIAYNEESPIEIDNEGHIRQQIKGIIERKFSRYNNAKIDLEQNPILKRITYVAFPIWKMRELLEKFQEMIQL